MALWKPYRGNHTSLETQPLHDGYVYFCTDDGSLFFDYTDADGNLQRKQISAKDAETIMGQPIDALKAYDAIITTEEEFRKCTYMLHPNKNEDGSIDLTTKGEANPDFDYRYILVRGVDFTENLGTSDLNLAVLQPSIRYIKFDNCQWHCQWWISGKEPTELQPNPSGIPTEYKHANGPLNVVLDGINISEDNINSGLEPDKYYIGLRNFERIENCFINYPDDYELLLREDGEYRYSFKFNLQYFNTIQNCKVTALWDGSNISGCRISERVVRCNNCTNIIAEPVYKNGELYRVQMRESSNLSNIYGSPIIYSSCTSIDPDTCSGYSRAEANPHEFDLTITTLQQFKELPNNTTATNVLVTGFNISGTTLVTGFFGNNAGDAKYWHKFVIPTNVKYIKFSKSFWFNSARVCIQGHPDCIIDGFPTITAPYKWSHNTVLYDFKEVRNCYARGVIPNQPGEMLEENHSCGISNIFTTSIAVDNWDADLKSDYNFKGTRFVNCDIIAVDGANMIENCRVYGGKGMPSPSILNVDNISGLTIQSIPTTQTLKLTNCKHVSNVNANGFKLAYVDCSQIDTETCDNVPDSIKTYASKDYVKDAVDASANSLNNAITSTSVYDVVITTIQQLQDLQTNTTAHTALVKGFHLIHNKVTGFFTVDEKLSSAYKKYIVPSNIKYIKFDSTFTHYCQRIVIQGHEDCIIEGLNTVAAPYDYSNAIILYNFKEVRNCRYSGDKTLDEQGNLVVLPQLTGISNTIISDPSATKYPDLAPAHSIQKTRFVDCDITYIDGAESVENCRVIAWAKLANPNNGMGYPRIHNVNFVSGLEIKHIPGNYKLSIKNCNTVSGVNANSFIIEYDGCANIGATQKYVDEAAANAGKIKDVVATSNSGLKVTTNEGVAVIDWDEEVVFVFDGGGVEEEFIAKYSEGLKFTSNGNGTCSVSGIGTCTDVDLMIPPTSPDGDEVISIGSQAFNRHYSLKSVVIPNSVTLIGAEAFQFCSALMNVVIPDSVETIGKRAFWTCSSLASITIPNSIINIGTNAFSNCHNLKSVYISDITKWLNFSFDDSGTNPLNAGAELYLIENETKTLVTDFIVPENITKIGKYAFQNCTSLTSVMIPDSVTSIDSSAFQSCDSLASVTIGNSVTSIGNYAFSYCDSLASVTIGNSVTSIGSDTFTYCGSLASVTIPESVTSIGARAFYYCTSLTSVTIPESVTSIGDRAFYNCGSITNITVDEDNITYKSINGNLYSKDEKTLIQYAINNTNTTLTIPDSVTSISNGAFAWCDSLTSITIPDFVTSIGAEAFYKCSSLTSVTIGKNVAFIGAYAFYTCPKLVSIAYNGTVEQWSNISFANNWNGTPATYVQCTDGTVEL